jgi:hypothetical protein
MDGNEPTWGLTGRSQAAPPLHDWSARKRKTLRYRGGQPDAEGFVLQIWVVRRRSGSDCQTGAAGLEFGQSFLDFLLLLLQMLDLILDLIEGQLQVHGRAIA